MNENLGYHPSHQTALEQYAEAVQIERWENEKFPTIEEERAFEREHGHAWDDIPVRGWPGLVITRDDGASLDAEAEAEETDDLAWSDADQGYIPYADYEAEIRPEEMDEVGL